MGTTKGFYDQSEKKNDFIFFPMFDSKNLVTLTLCSLAYARVRIMLSVSGHASYFAKTNDRNGFEKLIYFKFKIEPD